MPGAAPIPYLLFPGTAREGLARYREVFGGGVELHTYGAFGRADGPGDAIAHGILTGPVLLFGADAGADEDAFSSTGLLLSLLGAADPTVSRGWFDALADGGRVLDPLVERPWHAWDGRVRDPFGVTWLIGWEPDAGA